MLISWVLNAKVVGEISKNDRLGDEESHLHTHTEHTLALQPVSTRLASAHLNHSEKGLHYSPPPSTLANDHPQPCFVAAPLPVQLLRPVPANTHVNRPHPPHTLLGSVVSTMIFLSHDHSTAQCYFPLTIQHPMPRPMPRPMPHSMPRLSTAHLLYLPVEFIHQHLCISLTGASVEVIIIQTTHTSYPEELVHPAGKMKDKHTLAYESCLH